MVSPSRLSPVAQISSSLDDFSLSPVPGDKPVADLTGQLEEIVSNPVAHGGYSDVYLYRARTSLAGRSAGTDIFAVKTARIKFFAGDKRKAIHRMRREIGVWSSLDHTNVLRLHGMLFRDNSPLPSLVSDYMAKGNADDYLRKNSEADPLHLICDMARGLSYLHKEGVAHGDIKANNILVAQDGCARIADFGLSRMLGNDGWPLESTTTDANRSSRWTPIENLELGPDAPQSHGPTKAGDVWSFGCTVLELLSGKLPFYDASEREVVLRLYHKELPKFPPYFLREEFEKYRAGVFVFCSFCWVKYPAQRPSMSVLESIICSYYAEAKESASLNGTLQDASSIRQDLQDQNQTVNNVVDAVNDDADGGSRSRSSSQSTLIPCPDAAEYPDIKVPQVSEPQEESHPNSSPQAIGSDQGGAGSVDPDSENLNNELPLPPPPSLEDVLRSIYTSAQAIVNELVPMNPGFTVRFTDVTSGLAHPNTYVAKCIVNGVEYDSGIGLAKKKYARERAALTALHGLYTDNPTLFPRLQYLPALKEYLDQNGLSSRVNWNSQSGPSAEDPTKWEHRVEAIFDGITIAVGVGSTPTIAEEHAARKVRVAWSGGITNGV